MAEIGGAKIARLIYDNDNDGMVDNAKHLDGCNVDYFATAGQGVHLYTQSSGTLSGSGENGKFKATATGTYIAFTIGGVSYAVKAGGETEIELTSGVWYSFILDTDAKTINFKSGGGLSNSKLALATATAADVLTGKTFYSGNKTLKTGTLNIKCMAMVTSAQGSASVYLCDGTTMKKGDTVSNNYCAFEYKDYNTYSLKSKIAGTYIIGGRNVNNSNIMPFTIKTVNANEYVFQNYAGNSSSGTQFIFAALVG
ncbi:MAG: hypothetical protein J6B21_04310 [Oscillospiraceae bacterium]|nr:hypothetical protein [Oscillospiraceae bacterium]